VLGRRPVNPRVITHRPSPGTIHHRPDPEVPLRTLIDKADRPGLRPVAARGTSPPSGGAGLSRALQHRPSDRGPPPTAVEATPSLTYERSCAAVLRGWLPVSDWNRRRRAWRRRTVTTSRAKRSPASPSSKMGGSRSYLCTGATSVQ
jgi:hypothetical protein